MMMLMKADMDDARKMVDQLSFCWSLSGVKKKSIIGREDGILRAARAIIAASTK